MGTGIYLHKSGWHHSEEAKRKISLANKGRHPLTEFKKGDFNV